MEKTESFLLVVALLGVAWIAFARHGSPSLMSPTLQGTSQTVPWYLNYNVMPPAQQTSLATIPQNSVGIQNDTGNPSCTVCSLFGASYGSQY